VAIHSDCHYRTAQHPTDYSLVCGASLPADASLIPKIPDVLSCLNPFTGICRLLCCPAYSLFIFQGLELCPESRMVPDRCLRVFHDCQQPGVAFTTYLLTFLALFCPTITAILIFYSYSDPVEAARQMTFLYKVFTGVALLAVGYAGLYVTLAYSLPYRTKPWFG
jgi:hypothetical protein